MIYTEFVSAEPLEIIRANEGDDGDNSLTRARFRRVWNELEDVQADRDKILTDRRALVAALDEARAALSEARAALARCTKALRWAVAHLNTFATGEIVFALADADRALSSSPPGASSTAGLQTAIARHWANERHPPDEVLVYTFTAGWNAAHANGARRCGWDNDGTGPCPLPLLHHGPHQPAPATAAGPETGKGEP